MVITNNADGSTRLLTSEEIAAILKISLNTVHSREWQKRNRCPLIKIGKRRYSVEAVFWKWVNERGMTNVSAH